MRVMVDSTVKLIMPNFGLKRLPRRFLPMLGVINDNLINAPQDWIKIVFGVFSNVDKGIRYCTKRRHDGCDDA